MAQRALLRDSLAQDFQPRTECAFGTEVYGQMIQRRAILVTGAASGIGAAICRTMAAADTAILVHTRRNRGGAETVAQQIREAGGIADVGFGDLTDPSVAADLVDTMLTRF